MDALRSWDEVTDQSTVTEGQDFAPYHDPGNFRARQVSIQCWCWRMHEELEGLRRKVSPFWHQGTE